jgi:DNA-binding transcriptional LysR family regulator
MIIRHLPFFAIAAEEENLQRAANRLGVTQPALSRRIQDLESELGVLLFDRSSGRLKLTPMGRLLGQEARRIVEDVEAITRELRRSSTKRTARLAIGLNERAVGNIAVSHAIRTYRKDNPGVDLTASIMSSVQQAEALREGRIDVAMLYLAPEETAFETRDLIVHDPYVVALPEGHRLATLGDPRLADLAGEDLIWPSSERVPLMYNHLVSIWRSVGLEPHVTTQVNSGEAALSAVVAGLGVAILRRSSTRREPPGVVIRSVPELEHSSLPVQIAWLERIQSPERRRFLRLLNERNLIKL